MRPSGQTQIGLQHLSYVHSDHFACQMDCQASSYLRQQHIVKAPGEHVASSCRPTDAALCADLDSLHHKFGL